VNVLVNDQGEASVVDFGLSRILETPGFTTKTESGTWRWMAYELLSSCGGEGEEFNPPVTKETDVWAFAMTVVEVGICSILDQQAHTNLLVDSHKLQAVLSIQT